MATDKDPVEPFELGSGEQIMAGQKGPTASPSTPGARGTFSVSRGNLSELESRRLIANIPDQETAQRLTENVGRATEVHRERSSRARTVDEQKDAPVTTSFEQWAANPRRWDFPGVDDPRTNAPEATGAERFAHKVETGRMGVDTPGPDMFDFRDLDPGVGTAESDEAVEMADNRDHGVGTLEQDDVTNWETEALFDFRERSFEGHEAARKGLRARGVRPGKTDTADDELMKDYLSDIRAVESELYERGALG